MPTHSRQSPSLLIALPHGLGVSGVVRWAVRLANELAARGRGAGLIVHPEPPGAARLELPIDPRVAVLRLPDDLPPLDRCRGDLEPYLPYYREAVARLQRERAGPVVLSPNLLGDCYGIAAVLTREFGERLRVVGWQHSDIEHDARVLARYAPVLGAFVAVSDRIDAVLRARLHAHGAAGRSADVAHIPYGVEVPDACPRPHPPGDAPRAGPMPQPLRLLYAGRIEHRQKRILALPALSAELARRGVEHRLTIVGDGPANSDLDDAIRGQGTIRRLPPASPAGVTRLLDSHDAVVLASRYEGLSVSMLEAMARGCVPIVTRTESGAPQAITDGQNGLIADADPDGDESAAAIALADAVERFRLLDRGAAARAAWRTVRDRFSLDRHAARVEALVDTLAGAPARVWPADRPAAFSALAAPAGGSGSVPPDGPQRMARVLGALAGRRVVIHGTGQHTLQLRDVILASPAVIVAFADDDRAKHGETLWGRPVIPPGAAAAAGATDVVISSWMHEADIAARWRGAGSSRVELHRVYG